MKYYLWMNEKAAGPFSAADVLDLRNRGLVDGETLLAEDGADSQWVKISDVKFTLPEPKPETSGCAVATLVCLGALIAFAALGVAVGYLKGESPANENAVVQSAWDGSISQVKRWCESHARDPDSIQYIEWSDVVKTPDGKFAVRVKLRSKNGFGGYEIQNLLVGMDANGDVIGAKNYSGE